jgi:phospholipase C
VDDPRHPRRRLTRRGLLKTGAFGAALTLPGIRSAVMSASAMAATRVPGSLPDPSRPAGTATAAMPFDHVVCVMMENHSFDNLLGALPRLGQANADGLAFDRAGQATNSNPSPNGTVTSFVLTNTEQPGSVDQSWDATHQQIDGGKMDGFVTSVNSVEPMGYWTDEVLPFAYSLARTFCLANRWFCSAPCQTYPNRRFLMAGTAYGDIATDTQSLEDAPPPNGTIFDRLHAYGISWANYFTDLPQTGIIPSIIEKYPGNLAPIAKFLTDCAAGTLPSVSFSSTPSSACFPISARRWRRCLKWRRSRRWPRSSRTRTALAAIRRAHRTCTTARRGRTRSFRPCSTPPPGRARC